MGASAFQFYCKVNVSNSMWDKFHVYLHGLNVSLQQPNLLL